MGSSYIRLTSPDGAKVHMGSSPSDVRALKNVRAKIPEALHRQAIKGGKSGVSSSFQGGGNPVSVHHFKARKMN
jgi:hypothetical protein